MPAHVALKAEAGNAFIGLDTDAYVTLGCGDKHAKLPGLWPFASVSIDILTAHFTIYSSGNMC